MERTVLDSRQLTNFWILPLSYCPAKIQNRTFGAQTAGKFWNLAFNGQSRKIRKHSNSAFEENSAGKFLNFDFNGQSSCKNSNRDFGRQSAGKFLNFVFNGVQQKIKMVLLAGRQLANFSILFLTDSRPAKNKKNPFGGKMASKIIFWKRATDRKNIITGIDHEWVHLFELFDPGQRDYLNKKKKTGKRKVTLHQYC